MLTERINKLFYVTGATGADVAKYAGFDRTNISRIRSGKRVPTPGSSTAARLVDGIYLYSDNKNDLKTLCELVGSDPKGTADEIKSQISKWLYEGYVYNYDDAKACKPSVKRGKRNIECRHFSERLNLSMSLANMSNVNLSRLLHADASLISRYRNGVRTPMSNPELSAKISGLLYDRIIKSEKKADLADALKLPITEIDDEVFFNWLYDRNDETDDNARVAENLLEILDSIKISSSSSIPDPATILAEISAPAESVYYGANGLRDAVLHFLTFAIEHRVKEMFLYSDEDQSWMTHDPSYLTKWASLMLECVKNGTHIYIIHNVDRDLDEMNDAIKSWLPLYMSGMIESYFCRKQRNSRFSHTFFLIPDHVCIKAFHAATSREDGIYHYYTDQRALEIFRKEFDSLLLNSSPLMTSLPSRTFPDVSNVITIQSSLSISTMSKELAESFNDSSLLDAWKDARAALLDKLKTNSIYELIPLATYEDLAAEKIIVGPPFVSKEVVYTPEQYKWHIKDIVKLSEEFDNYRFYPIPEPPFQNINLLISDNMTKITPAIRPGLSFAFSHPSMCLAFKSYAKTIMEKCKMDRNSLRKMLEERYLV